MSFSHCQTQAVGSDGAHLSHALAYVHISGISQLCVRNTLFSSFPFLVEENPGFWAGSILYSKNLQLAPVVHCGAPLASVVRRPDLLT